jgi:AraC-like DNA-binding protein
VKEPGESYRFLDGRIFIVYGSEPCKIAQMSTEKGYRSRYPCRSAASGPVREGALRMAPLLGLPRFLSDHGLDPGEVIRETGCDPALFEDPENTIDLAAVGRLFDRTAAVTGVECPGLELGRRSGVEVLGAVGQMMRFAPDLGTALHALIVQFHLHDRGAVPTLWERGTQTMFGYTIHSPGVPGTDHIYDAALAIALNTIKELVGKGWKPTEVQMFRDPPRDRRNFQRHFRTQLRFAAEHAAIVFPTADLTLPLLDADPQVYAVLCDKLEERNSASGGTRLSNRVRRLLRGMLAAGSGRYGIDLLGVARLLGLHPRTLTRRLRAEGAAFSSILEESRYEFARQLLRDTRSRIAEIAMVLGYAESASFNHAFRRWSGMTASAWRSLEESRNDAGS